MALQFILIVSLLAWGEPVKSQMTDMYQSSDMYDTTDQNLYATVSDTGNPPQDEMSPTNVNSPSGNGSEIITGEVKPN